MGICSSKATTEVVIVQPVDQERYYIDYAGLVQSKANQLDFKVTALNTYILEAFDRANEIKSKRPYAKTPKIKLLADKALNLSESAQKSLRDLNGFFPNLQSVQNGVLLRISNTLSQQMSMISVVQNQIVSQLLKE